MQLSIIIPVFNDAPTLHLLLTALAPLRARQAEIIVVDGSSKDDPHTVAQGRVDCIITAPKGRAAQQHAGAQVAHGDALWFVHADCTPPANADALIQHALQHHPWGRFDVRLRGQSRWLPLVAWMMNQRSRITGICTGDQGIFVARHVYAHIGGMPQITLMEDIAFSKRLKCVGRPACITTAITASGRRWDKHGALRTIMHMWWLRLRYFFGADPQALHRSYYGRQ
jgi:rSAM/selenodomain-associated transferase 2